MQDVWDYGQKTFASRRYPDIAGYWGDVLFPIVALSQHFSNLDAGIGEGSATSADLRFKGLEQALRISFGDLPQNQRRAFTIVHVSRDGSGMDASFEMRGLSWSPSTSWTREEMALPSNSAAVRLGGSGARATKLRLHTWEQSKHGGTSRAVFSAFVDGLTSGGDPHTGGPPQLVGLYRIDNGRSIGTVVGSRRYLHGASVTAERSSDQIEWRNELFERLDGRTKKRLKGAQRHETL